MTILVPDEKHLRVPALQRDVAERYRDMRQAGEDVKLARSPKDLREHEAACRGETLGPRRRIWIGQGTNTWKSDLLLNVSYERTRGRADVAGATLGIPWMAGIPGTVGGWIKMNAGAFGHSISEALEAVQIDGVWRSAADCGFAYRHSDITGEIQDFRLKASDAIASEGTVEEYLKRRRHFPAHTWGSFFKNPPGDAAGRLLERAGAKELRVGGASVWQEHANVIVAGESATPSDVLALARLMTLAVLKTSDILLEPEVQGLWH